jgi:hypothetical protein
MHPGAPLSAPLSKTRRRAQRGLAARLLGDDPRVGRRLARALAASVLVPSLGLASLLSGCKTNVLSSKTEDEARLMIPVPICVKRLPRGTTPGAVVSLTPDEYWPILLPSFDRNQRTVDATAPDCSGRLSLSNLSPQSSPTLRVDPEKVTIAPGADGMKIVWLQSHPLGEDTYEGLIALTRQRESYMEVYAVGVHRGRPEGTKFALQRMGPRYVVEGIQEDCTGNGAERRCRAAAFVYLVGTGSLRPAASFPVEQSARSNPKDGNSLDFRFSASTDYKDTSIELTEHLSVSAKGQGEIRVSDLERAFRLEGTQLVASGESLWTKTLRELGQKPTD